MKIRRLFIITVLILIIANISTKCYAKYMYHYTKKAAEINIINN